MTNDDHYFALTDAQRERIEALYLDLNGRELLAELGDDRFGMMAWRVWHWLRFRDRRVMEYGKNDVETALDIPTRHGVGKRREAANDRNPGFSPIQ